MDIGLLNILRIGATASWDFRFDMAQGYAMALRNAIEMHLSDGSKKQECFFLSLKGTQTAQGNFQDRLYVGDVRYVENHLRWNDEELADDDQIINVVVIEGPVTRDGGACSYGTKDFRNQVEYANSIPQVVGHIFVCNTPGGESACRNDYDEMFASCRANNKATVQYVDGMCGSSGVNLGCRCDRVIVRNPKDDYGCIGSMAAFWATPDGAVDHNGTRYVEVVGEKSPNKNDWYREAAQGDYEKLMAMVNRDTEEFQQTVRENRPNVKEEHLTGTVFAAQEVLGSLVDEIGDFNRAIECVLQLADGSLASVRDAEVIAPEEKPEEEQQPEQEPGNEPEEQVKTVSVGFTPVTVEETSTPNNNDNNMTQEELKAAEVAQQPAAAQEETPAVEQPAAEAAPAAEAPAAAEETPAQEPAAEPAAEPAQEETPAAEPASAEPAAEPTQEETPEEPAAPAEETPAEPAAEPASQEAVEEATAELDRITETLHTAERMIEEKDATIANLKAEAEGKDNSIEQLQQTLDGARHDIETANATIAARDKSIEEKDALIAQLKGQVADLRAEVKELAGKPAPMTDGAAGVPQDNGTGAAPEAMGTVRSTITADMTPAEIRAALKKQDEEAKARMRRR